jgi:glycyl-tRNA synthetase
MASEQQPLEDMSALQDQLDALNAQITKQGSHVRQLKKDGAGDEISGAVEKLQALKIKAAGLSEKLEADAPKFNRKSFDDLVLRKMFVVPSFEIHGGVKGLFDLGPPACALKV